VLKYNSGWASSSGSFHPTPTSTVMPWSRLSVRRSEDSKSPRRPSSSSPSEEEPEDDKTPQPNKETNPHPPPAHDPSLTKLFTDAASYDQILNTCTAEDDAEDSRAARDSPNGFSQLIGRDLEDHERVASETLAQLSVTTWAPGESTDLAPDDGVDESEEGPEEAELDKIEPSDITLAADEPKIEDKLKPDEILDLLQQDFGALAPPGEEKLLLESDATLFQEVVVLVCQSIWDNP
jgi:sterol 3beta-glucosyltransferase